MELMTTTRESVSGAAPAGAAASPRPAGPRVGCHEDGASVRITVDPEPYRPAALAALYTGLGLLAVSLPAVVASLLAGAAFADGAMLPVGVSLAGMMCLAGFAVAQGSADRRRLEIVYDRDRGMLRVRRSGAQAGGRLAWEAGQVDDVRVGVARGLDGRRPVAELRITPRPAAAGGRAVSLMPGFPPRDLLWMAAALRGLLGLPALRDVRRTNLQALAAAHQPLWQPACAAAGGTGATGGETPPAAPPAPPVTAVAAAVPVLSYAPGGRPSASLGESVHYGPDTLSIRLWPVAADGPGDELSPDGEIYLTPDALTVRDGGGRLTWDCDGIYCVYAGFRWEGGAAELFVCHASGIRPLLAGRPLRELHAVARLLSDALGIPGGVW